jgi:protein-disulfide isomerase
VLFAQETQEVQIEILATVDGQEITAAEIENSIKGQMLRINNEIYSVKKQAVDALITDRLLGQEATKRNISRAELLKQEVTDKTEAVTDKEIEEFYTKNKARMGNKPLEEMKARVTQHLQGTKNQQRQQAFTAELRKAAAVKINLQAPIVEVAVDGSPTRGAAQAPVTLVEFSDYQCPYCARVQAELKKVRETYKDQVKIVFKDFPLSHIHPQAQKAAEAARCAGEQDKYWDYHDVLFQNSKALQIDQLKKYAADLQLDTAAFDTCLDSSKHAAAVRTDVAQGSELGVTGTPAFFVNGRFISGAQQFPAFQELIDSALTAQ